MTVNKAILVGNTGADPEVNYIREDLPVAKFRLATSETYTKDGERVTNTEWHNIVAWRGLAKVVEKYVKKGTQLYIEGKISTRSYEKEGETKYITEIVADNLRLLGRKSDDNAGGAAAENRNSYSRPSSDYKPDTPPGEDTAGADDDLPF